MYYNKESFVTLIRIHCLLWRFFQKAHFSLFSSFCCPHVLLFYSLSSSIFVLSNFVVDIWIVWLGTYRTTHCLMQYKGLQDLKKIDIFWIFSELIFNLLSCFQGLLPLIWLLTEIWRLYLLLLSFPQVHLAARPCDIDKTKFGITSCTLSN